MTPEQFRTARQEMGLTQQQMAFVLRSDVGAVQEWESGAQQISGPVQMAVFLLKHCSDVKPQPDGSVVFSNRYLTIAEQYGYKVPPCYEGPLPPQGAA